MGLVLSATLLFAGCSNDKPFSEEQQETYMNEYMDLVVKPTEPKELMKKLDESIKKLDQEQASHAIDGLLYAMFQFMPDMSTKLQGLQSTLMKYEGEVDFNNEAEVKEKIDDATLKAFLEEVHSRYFRLAKENGQYVLHPNMDLIVDKFEPYMSEDLKAMVMFSKSEYDKAFFDEETQSFDLDLVVERILTLEENLKKHEGSYYVDGMSNSKNYYYQVYFGTNNEFLIDENSVVLKEVLEHYQKVVKEHADTQLAKDVQAFLDKLKETNNKVTDDVYVFLLDLTKADVPTVTEEGEVVTEEAGSTAQDQANDQIKDAIQEAIKENSNAESEEIDEKK